MAFAGDGKLSDSGPSAPEFRAFLAQIPSTLLVRYVDECLIDSFNGSGLVLQDVINEIGRRLGFDVVPGRYRGVAGQVGLDGLWRSQEGHAFVIEVKTTDTYRVDLDTIVGYRTALVQSASISEDHSSVLIVVGRQDTGDLEAQIRGSRHAWDVRLISSEALLKLLAVKEDVDDPHVRRRIHAILIPREFTRLDEIVDVLFSTAEEIKHEAETQVGEDAIEGQARPSITAAFHEACIRRIERALSTPLVKMSKVTFQSGDDSVRLFCAVSKEYIKGATPGYWYSLRPHHEQFLAATQTGYVAFGCGSSERLLLIPYSDFSEWLDGLHQTTTMTQSYRHVNLLRTGERIDLVRRQNSARVDLSNYLL